MKNDNQSQEIDKIIKALLQKRGLKTFKQIKEFFTPLNPYEISYSDLGINPKAMKTAITQIKKAIKEKLLIIVYGDYDADGICATAIVWETLHALGAKVMPFIPQRDEHGYGLSSKGIQSLIKTYRPSDLSTFRPLSLIITVDNGIVANNAVKVAQDKGIEVIITDHHQKGAKIPKALAIIHSTQVSGSGVAWFFSKEIYQNFHHNLQGFKASNALELACIGTVTDMMPMLNVNRSLVKFGLRELQKSQRPGINALCQEAGVPQDQIETYHLGYIIGPRINAMGRLLNALDSLRLLCTNSQKRAQMLAAKLGLTNRERQQLTATTFAHAKDSAKLKAKSSKLIFISHSSYNQGVIGLVAGKLVEEFNRPAVVVALEKEYSKGSVRSIKGFNIIKALRSFNHIFEDLGGHPMAAGFTIATNKIPLLKRKLSKLKINPSLLKKNYFYDLEIDLTDCHLELYEAIETFSPFGLENPKPVFLTKKVKVVDVRTVGREKQHLKLKLASLTIDHQSLVLSGIAFAQGSLINKIKIGKSVDIYYSLEKNEWNGSSNLELIIKNLKIC